MKITKLLHAGVAAAILVVLHGCDTNEEGNKDTLPDNPEPIAWAECGNNPALECGVLTAPMDYDNPTTRSIKIALSRLPATGDTPMGSLLINPGGPGGSAIELISDIEDGVIAVPDAVRRAYHLVGFDPRGVNESTPIDCRNLGLEEISDYAGSLDELQNLEADTKAFFSACQQKVGDYLLHIGSLPVVRDMELIRKALDERQLNFLGYSYGTRLAAMYAQKFPEFVGRFVLDGSLSPNSSSIRIFEDQLTALEANFLSLTQSCTAYSQCDPMQFKQQIEERLQSLRTDQAEDELELLGSLIRVVSIAPDVIEFISQPLFEYLQGFDTTKLEQASQFLQLGGGDDSPYDEETLARAVVCSDDGTRRTIDDIESLRDRFNAASDLFAETQLAGAAFCVGWPEALSPVPDIVTSVAPQTLVIGGATDAQTPIIWSEQMAQAIGGRFLRSEHSGHTVVFRGTNSCVDEAVTAFLIDGNMPAIEVCEAEE